MRTYVGIALLNCFIKGRRGCSWILTGGGCVGQCQAVVWHAAGLADVVVRVPTNFPGLNECKKICNIWDNFSKYHIMGRLTLALHSCVVSSKEGEAVVVGS